MNKSIKSLLVKSNFKFEKKISFNFSYSGLEKFKDSNNKIKIYNRPINVAITGGAGNIGYSLSFKVGEGELFGPNQLINLRLVDIPQAENKLYGCKLELDDCNFPCINQVTTHTDLSSGFKDVDCVFIIGVANTVAKGERVDGLRANAEIMRNNGKALNDYANKDCKVLVVGNPVNTNALIAMKHAPRLNPQNFHAMSRLDHNRVINKLSDMLKVHRTKIENVFIWGNHDATMYPELHFGFADGKKITDLLDENTIDEEIRKFVADRWKEILHFRCITSCASAGKAAIDHMRDWYVGSQEWISKSILVDDRISKLYNIPKDLIFSLPVQVESTVKDNLISSKVKVIDNLKLNEFTKSRIEITSNSLLNEKKMIENYL